MKRFILNENEKTLLSEALIREGANQFYQIAMLGYQTLEKKVEYDMFVEYEKGLGDAGIQRYYDNHKSGIFAINNVKSKIKVGGEEIELDELELDFVQRAIFTLIGDDDATQDMTELLYKFS